MCCEMFLLNFVFQVCMCACVYLLVLILFIRDNLHLNNFSTLCTQMIMYWHDKILLKCFLYTLMSSLHKQLVLTPTMWNMAAMVNSPSLVWLYSYPTSAISGCTPFIKKKELAGRVKYSTFSWETMST